MKSKVFMLFVIDKYVYGKSIKILVHYVCSHNGEKHLIVMNVTIYGKDNYNKNIYTIFLT